MQTLFDATHIFASSDPREVRLGTSSALTGHDLVWREGAVGAPCAARSWVLCRSRHPALWQRRRYLRPRQAAAFHAVQVPLSGMTHVRVEMPRLREPLRGGGHFSACPEPGLGAGVRTTPAQVPPASKGPVAGCWGATSMRRSNSFPSFPGQPARPNCWRHQISTLLCYLGGRGARPGPVAGGPGRSAHPSSAALSKKQLQRSFIAASAGAQKKSASPPSTSMRICRSLLRWPVSRRPAAPACALLTHGLPRMPPSVLPMAYVRRERMEAAHNGFGAARLRMFASPISPSVGGSGIWAVFVPTTRRATAKRRCSRSSARRGAGCFRLSRCPDAHIFWCRFARKGFRTPSTIPLRPRASMMVCWSADSTGQRTSFVDKTSRGLQPGYF